MSKIQGFTLTGNALCVVIDGESYVVDRTHTAFRDLVDMVKDGDSEGFVELFGSVNLPSEFTDNEVTIEGDVVYFMGKPMHSCLTKRMLEVLGEGLDVMPYARFLSNLMRNPNRGSVEQLYSFLEHEHLPITDDGCFLGYKSVNNDWTDKHSGRVNNFVGSVIEMSRDKVDPNPDSHCSHGYHVGAWEYSGHGGWFNGSSDRVLLVKVNPRDVVSVPNDHNAQKLRCCKYEVMQEVSAPLNGVYAQDKSENWIFVSPEELETDDVVDFNYNKDDGTTKHYSGTVDHVGSNYVTIAVGDDEFKNFSFGKIENLKMLENDGGMCPCGDSGCNDSDWDAYENEDDDDWDDEEYDDDDY